MPLPLAPKMGLGIKVAIDTALLRHLLDNRAAGHKVIGYGQGIIIVKVKFMLAVATSW